MLLGIAYFPPVSYFALIAKGMTIPPATPPIVYIEARESYRKQSWRNRCRIYAADGPEYLNFPIVHEGSRGIPITGIKVDYTTPWVVKTERAISSAYESSAYYDHYKDDLFAILDSRPETLFELDLRIIRFFLQKIGIQADLRLTEDYIPAGAGGPVCAESAGGLVCAESAGGLAGSGSDENPVGAGSPSGPRRFEPCPGKCGPEGLPVTTADNAVTADTIATASATGTVATAGKYGEDYRDVLHPKRPNTVLRDLGLEKPYFQVFARKHGFIPDLSIMDLLFNEGPDSILYLKNGISSR